ncbi:MAG: outer membrane beta-barrel family protein [Tidjanibacter sp.]|nr:outer membrane beta-barrel family protein [Tidjanibacter sp.]
MKKFFALLIVCSVFGSIVPLEARIVRQNQIKISGRVCSADAVPVAYATVVLLMPDGSQAAGTVSGTDGEFELSASKGTYTLTASYMGYNEVSQTIVLSADVVLEPLLLSESATQIETLTIKGSLITREADRFVMNVAESPLSTGRDTYEMLSLAPGVWIKDDDIKINGKSGAKIFINEREVRMSGTEFVNYLKAMPAENIQKIEVYPMAGADQDANLAGGIIKITVRRQRNDGVSGSVGMSGYKGRYENYAYNPWFSVNYNRGKLNLYGNGNIWGQSILNNAIKADEKTTYENGSTVNSTMNVGSVFIGGGMMIGTVYDLTPSSSIGAEYNFWNRLSSTDDTRSLSDFVDGANRTSNDSHYLQSSNGYNQGLTLNYIYKLDTLGSTFKLIGDFAQNVSDGRNDYENAASHYLNDIQQGPSRDSLYYNTAESDYRIYTLTSGIEKILSPTSVLKYGAKFTLADTYSQSNYFGQNTLSQAWESQSSYDRTTDYNEYVGALYATYSKRFKSGISVVGGLRGEYTYIPALGKKYFDLFPNLNLMVPLTQDQMFSLAAAYARKISRPSFWAMNPLRSQLSEYSYQIGNPNLRPMYTDDISLTAIMGGKYSLTAGVQLITDQSQQICKVDENDPNVLVYYHENLSSNHQYYLNLNAPINITDWWTLNLNATAVNINQRIYADSDKLSMWLGFVNGTSSFTLPKKWFIDVEAFYQSDVMSGNMKMLAVANCSLKLKKRMLSDKLTVAVGIDNTFKNRQTIISSMPGSFYKVLHQPDQNYCQLRLSASYNFQAGKMFRRKSVESGAVDEKSRMGGNSK